MNQMMPYVQPVEFIIQQMIIFGWSVMAVVNGSTSNVPKLKAEDLFLSLIIVTYAHNIVVLILNHVISSVP